MPLKSKAAVEKFLKDHELKPLPSWYHYTDQDAQSDLVTYRLATFKRLNQVASSIGLPPLKHQDVLKSLLHTYQSDLAGMRLVREEDGRIQNLSGESCKPLCCLPLMN